jgi:hypothetical protein
MKTETVSIVFPDGKCIDGGHFYINLTREIWWCKKCWKSKWLPFDVVTAREFGLQVRFKGIDLAYKNVLDHNQSIVKVLTKLESLRAIRTYLPDQAMVGKLLEEAVATNPTNSRQYRLRLRLLPEWLDIELIELYKEIDNARN